MLHFNRLCSVVFKLPKPCVLRRKRVELATNQWITLKPVIERFFHIISKLVLVMKVLFFPTELLTEDPLSLEAEQPRKRLLIHETQLENVTLANQFKTVFPVSWPQPCHKGLLATWGGSLVLQQYLDRWQLWAWHTMNDSVSVVGLPSLNS